MPITWDQATYAEAVRSRCRVPEHNLAKHGHDHGDVFAYGREMMAHGRFAKYESWRDLLINNFGVAASDRLLIAGCGFGYTIEAFHDAGFPWVGGIEVSAHIIGKKTTEVRGDALFVEDDLSNSGLDTKMESLQEDLGVPVGQRSSRWDYIVTESMLESYTDAELPGLLDDTELELEIDTNLAHIVHFVHTDPMPFLPGANRKTLAKWAAMRPTHSWQDVNGAKGFIIGSVGSGSR